jgi:hypothetical protein
MSVDACGFSNIWVAMEKKERFFSLKEERHHYHVNGDEDKRSIDYAASCCLYQTF